MKSKVVSVVFPLAGVAAMLSDISKRERGKEQDGLSFIRKRSFLCCFCRNVFPLLFLLNTIIILKRSIHNLMGKGATRP